MCVRIERGGKSPREGRGGGGGGGKPEKAWSEVTGSRTSNKKAKEEKPGCRPREKGRAGGKGPR